MGPQKVMGSKFKPSGGLQVKHLEAQSQWTYLISSANNLSGEVGCCVAPTNHELPNQEVAHKHQLFYTSLNPVPNAQVCVYLLCALYLVDK